MAWASEPLAKHKNPEALPYLEKARERIGAFEQDRRGHKGYRRVDEVGDYVAGGRNGITPGWDIRFVHSCGPPAVSPVSICRPGQNRQAALSGSHRKSSIRGRQREAFALSKLKIRGLIGGKPIFPGEKPRSIQGPKIRKLNLDGQGQDQLDCSRRICWA